MSDAIYSENYRSIVRSLRAVREEKGVHQADLGRAIGKKQSHISKIERGDRKLDVLEICSIARALDMDAVELFARITVQVKDA